MEKLQAFVGAIFVMAIILYFFYWAVEWITLPGTIEKKFDKIDETLEDINKTLKRR